MCDCLFGITEWAQPTWVTFTVKYLSITQSATCCMSGFHWLIDVIFLIKYERPTKRNTTEIQPRDQIDKSGWFVE